MAVFVDGLGNRRNDGVIGNADACLRKVSPTPAHEAAFDGSIQKRLLAGVLAVGRCRSTAADGESWKPEPVGR